MPPRVRRRAPRPTVWKNFQQAHMQWYKANNIDTSTNPSLNSLGHIKLTSFPDYLRLWGSVGPPDWDLLPAAFQLAYRNLSAGNFPTDQPPPTRGDHFARPTFLYPDHEDPNDHFNIPIVKPDPGVPMRPQELTDLPFDFFPEYAVDERIYSVDHRFIKYRVHPIDDGIWYPNGEIGKGGYGRAILWVKTGIADRDEDNGDKDDEKGVIIDVRFP